VGGAPNRGHVPRVEQAALEGGFRSSCSQESDIGRVDLSIQWPDMAIHSQSIAIDSG